MHNRTDRQYARPMVLPIGERSVAVNAVIVGAASVEHGQCHIHVYAADHVMDAFA